MNKKRRLRGGFTLVEILIVIGILAILAAVVLVAINPARQFAQARNSERLSAITTILSAVGQKVADNRGLFAGGIPACPTSGAGALAANTASTSIDRGAGGTGADLSCLTPTYMSLFPNDPTSAAGVDTGYDISVDAVGRITICAPSAIEAAIPGSTALCVTR